MAIQRFCYRLGLDVGTNSIGWCCLSLGPNGEPTGILDMGVRILSPNEEAGRDPQTGTSRASDRRVARAMRRNRDRGLLRKQDLMRVLVARGLMPADPQEAKELEGLDPYELRAKGLDEPLTPFELGRAIFHLAQRRGFKSNRKTDGADDDPGKIKTAIDSLRQGISARGARTAGEYLYLLHRERKPVRARLVGRGANAAYNLYLSRELIAEEFDCLWKTQARFNSALTDDVRDEIGGTAELRHANGKANIIFRQRPLRLVSPGKCSLIPEDERAPMALPAAQRFRILKELANLQIIDGQGGKRFVTLAERDMLYAQLRRRKHMTFGQLRKALKLNPDCSFNLESENRDRLQGDETAARLSQKKCFGPGWHERRDQTVIVERLLAEQEEVALIAWLMANCSLAEANAREVAKAALPDHHLRYGRKALERLLPVMKSEAEHDRRTGELLERPIGEFSAIERLKEYFPGWRDQYAIADLPRLPYYGVVLQDHVSGTGDPCDPREKRYGRLANPTVHIGLNQIRRLVNKLIDAYGKPEEIVIEFARDLKLSQKQKKKEKKKQSDNQTANRQRREKLRTVGQADTPGNVLRLRLWEELNLRDVAQRKCIFTGKPISIRQLFTEEVEIEHLLPFGMTLDNSPANKTVCFREANRIKAKRPPHDAFHTNSDFVRVFGSEASWDAIYARAKNLPGNKSWRFMPDAMERFLGKQEDGEMLPRHLTDTAYLARITKKYLGHVCDPKNIWVTNGRLTAILRRKWGLNRILEGDNLRPRIDDLTDEERDKLKKDRHDSRHHAIDACAIAATERSRILTIQTLAGQLGERLDEKLRELDVDPPWDGFRDEVREKGRAIVVSHRPDHGTQGRLHEETAYGLVRDPVAEDGYNLVFRKPLAQLTEKEVDRIRDGDLRENAKAIIKRKKGEGVKHADALAQFADQTGIRRVRLLKKEQGVIEIADKSGNTYKAYSPGDNHRIEIYRRPESDRWEGEAVTKFQANQPDYVPRWRREHPNAKLIMTVHNGDLIKAEVDGKELVLRVVRLNAAANRLWLAEAHEDGDLQKRHDAPAHLDPFRWKLFSYGRLHELKARRIRIDEIGRVYDSGPPG